MRPTDKEIQAIVDAKSLPICLTLGANARMRWDEWKANQEL